MKDPFQNYRNSFDGAPTTYGITNAVVKVIYAYTGFENAFNVVNEVKVRLGLSSGLLLSG